MRGIYDMLPQAGKDFLDAGGWWLVILLVALLVLAVLGFVFRGVLGLFGGRKKKDEEAGLDENLAEYPPAPKPGPRRLLVDGTPARLRLVVLAPSGRGQTVTADQAEPLLELVLRGLGSIAQQDRPRVRVWPPQLSQEGFTQKFHRHTKKPEAENRPSRWVIVAGQGKAGRQTVLLGLALEAEDKNALGRLTLGLNDWSERLRVQSGNA